LKKYALFEQMQILLITAEVDLKRRLHFDLNHFVSLKKISLKISCVFDLNHLHLSSKVQLLRRKKAMEKKAFIIHTKYHKRESLVPTRRLGRKRALYGN
jgi:hypothetical protein